MNVLFKVYHSLSKWKVFVGIDVRKAPLRSIILFPVLPGFICCGFAGVITVKRADIPAEPELVTKIIRLFQKTK